MTSNQPARWLPCVLAGLLVLLSGSSGAQAERASTRYTAATGSVAEYPSMTALRKVEQEGIAYELTWTITGSPLIVVAPHGGAIEPRTSEIAAAIAGAEHTQCHFKGKLPAGQNHPRLHVTSENRTSSNA